jgi:hypothetical protein
MKSKTSINLSGFILEISKYAETSYASLNQIMVWGDFGISIIMTEETSPVKEFMMALGAFTGAGDCMSEKKRTGNAEKPP